MAMSRKHYRVIAEAIRTNDDKRKMILELSMFFKEDNPNFNLSKFLEACHFE